jgi:phospholipid transport system substrate-binding protein
MSIKKWGLGVVLSVYAAVGLAQNDFVDPYQKIEHVTTELLSIIGQYRETYPDTEDAYFADLDKLLSTNIDFGSIATNVMGQYVKKATPEQREKFIAIFRSGLVETYGRGLISYNNQKIILVDDKAIPEGQSKATIKQEIRSSDSIYPLEYTLRRKKSGEWVVVNVIINGINLGKIFRNQFAQSAQRAGGDIDHVISGWSSSNL